MIVSENVCKNVREQSPSDNKTFNLPEDEFIKIRHGKKYVFLSRRVSVKFVCEWDRKKNCD